jgi:uridine kinase
MTIEPLEEPGSAAGTAGEAPDDGPVVHPSGEAPLAGAFVIGIVGDSGSGKNTVADVVSTLLGRQRVTDLRLDDYHRFTRAERHEKGLTPLNPIVHNLPLMQEHLRLLRQGRPIRNRSYLHDDGSFGPIRLIEAREMVVARGLLGYPTPELQDLYDLRVFLEPEPDLLFRWKLRRDMLFRGYTEAAVLKTIAIHLLDSKEFVLPQAARAHVHVRYELPDWEAPDSEVRSTIRLRGSAADPQVLRDLAEALPVEVTPGEEPILRIPAEVPREAVERWLSVGFPAAPLPDTLGMYHDEKAELCYRASLAIVEGLIALLGERIRHRRTEAAH